MTDGDLSTSAEPMGSGSQTISRTGPGVRVSFDGTWDGWRREARRLLTEGISPRRVDWLPDGQESQGELFAGAPSPEPPSSSTSSFSTPMDPAPPHRPRSPGSRPRPRVPRAFLDQARLAAHHRDPGRWSLLYRLLWRLGPGGEPHLLAVEVDPEVAELRRLFRQVKRDLHKMHAFVRFRRIEETGLEETGFQAGGYEDDGYEDDEREEPGGGRERYVAWHRPDHLIAPLAARFFVERFNDQRWSILTPDASIHWDRSELTHGPGVPVTEAPDPDRLEDIWKTYYAATFNPARVNPRAMKAELPVRHWATLPEAELIPGLLRRAGQRGRDLIEAPRRPPAHELIEALDLGPHRQSSAAGLRQLAEALPRCEACPRCENGTRPVFGEGPPEARLMLVGEQPGDQEERQGRPFVGPAGQVLDRALAEAGLDRDRLYLTNAVKHFGYRLEENASGSGAPATDPRTDPRGARRIHKSPGLIEITSCRPWVLAEAEQVAPQGIVLLGASAARSLIEPGIRLKDVRGQILQGGSEGRFLLPTHHPSAILRQGDPARAEGLRRELVADLRRAAAALRSAPPSPRSATPDALARER